MRGTSDEQAFHARVCRLPSKQEKANWIHVGSTPTAGAIHARLVYGFDYFRLIHEKGWFDSTNAYHFCQSKKI